MRVNVAGIDISSFAVDVVLLDEDSNRATRRDHFALTGSTPLERTRSLRGVFPSRTYWEDNGVYLAGIEDPHSRFPHVAKAMGLVTGGVAALLPRDLCVIHTAPKEWKRIFAANANASKDAVRARVIEFVSPDYQGLRLIDPQGPWPQDAYDAYGIAWAVRALNNEAIQRGAA
jgi:hypothetical protein